MMIFDSHDRTLHKCEENINYCNSRTIFVFILMGKNFVIEHKHLNACVFNEKILSY